MEFGVVAVAVIDGIRKLVGRLRELVEIVEGALGAHQRRGKMVDRLLKLRPFGRLVERTQESL